MSSLAIVQFGTGDYETMINLSRAHHQKLCDQFGFELITEHIPKERHPFWEKPRMIREAMESHDKVVWLDADAIWMRGNLEDAFLGDFFHMVLHGSRNGLPAHLNAGVIYIQTCDDTKRIVEEWAQTPDDDHQWHDQWALMKVRDVYPRMFRSIPKTWNSVEWVSELKADHPNVAAWHGASYLAQEWIPKYIASLEQE